MDSATASYRGHRFPPEIISHGVWLYHRFCLSFGGVGFLLAPAVTLKLFFSNGDYGDVMPRLVGMFMLALAAFVAEFARRGDDTYWTETSSCRRGRPDAGDSILV